MSIFIPYSTMFSSRPMLLIPMNIASHIDCLLANFLPAEKYDQNASWKKKGKIITNLNVRFI